MTAPLPRHARGRRPAFHEQASIDRLLAMVLALTSEVSVLAERVATLERLGEAAGWLTAGAADGYAQPPEERRAREAAREALLGRVFAVLHGELADLEGGGDAAYWGAVERIERGEV